MKKYVGLFFMFFLLVGCSVNNSNFPDTELQKKGEKIESKEGLKNELSVSFDSSKKNLNQDESFFIDIHFNPKEKQMTHMTEVIEIFQDSDMKQPVSTYYDYDKKKKRITLSPPRIPVGSLGTLDVDKLDFGFNRGELLFYNEPNKQWGRLKQLYAVTKVDLKTGEQLEQPSVQILEIEQKIEEAPQLMVELDKTGKPIFRWKSVQDASYYYIVTFDYDKEQGFSSQGFVREKMNDTEWTPEDNKEFIIFKVSEVERETKDNVEKYGEGSEPILKESELYKTYGVVAVNKDGTSAISNLVTLNNLAKRLPLNEELNKSLEEETNTTISKIDLLPSYRYVTMADGSLSQKLINYHIKEAKEVEEVWGEYENENLSDLKSRKVKMLAIPYSIEGTPFNGVAKVTNYDTKKWSDKLLKVSQRQDDLRTKAGFVPFEFSQKEVAIDGKVSDVKIDTQTKITSHTKFADYLAKEMLAYNESITLESFPESQSIEILIDNFKEALYQNPLILGVEDINLSRDGKNLFIKYEGNKENYLNKQIEIRQEVRRVVAFIIKDNMTDLEKEYAINDYLIETAKYDNAALENAEKNNFQKVDKEFSDSFNPYGVLLNNVGVCSSYAGAFKLLADEAGLNSIVVTGYLDGDVPHAWNKIRIDNSWHIIDVTNNANEYVGNSLLNAPNYAIKTILQEDKEYMIDSYLNDYLAAERDESKEFYHVKNKFYSSDDIVIALVDELKKNDTATFRTDYNLNAKQFDKIISNVNKKLKNDNLKGTYWNGVIFLSNK